MKSFHVTTGQVRFGLLVVLVVALLAAILAWPVGAQEEPQDFTVTESADITGDSTSATIIAAPAGADPSVSDPGEVYIVSGTNGSVVITITGASDGDWFGYSTAVAGDLNSDGYKDIIIGAPRDGNGRAYLFYGPFRDDGPLLISATNADRFFASPDPADYDFGEAVAPVHDLTADGVPELRIRAWFIDAGGWENSHTYILNGATGQGLFRITGTFPFDPWAIVEGDADGDGDVDQDDLDIILANQGRTGPDLSAQDGDVNGDGVVDMVDYNLADGNFGAAIFGGFGGLISQCTDPCPENCVGEVADNAEGFCGPICAADCGCAYDLIPLPDNWPDGLTDPPHEYERAFQIAILVYPHGDDEAVWDIDGVELIQSLEIFENYITFETAGFGQVLVTATYACCQGGCGTMEIPIFITCNGIPEPWLDTDYDGIVDGDECQLGLNWNFSDTDGDSMPDGWELDMEFDPLDPIDGDLDADQDGIPNFLEFLYGSDPLNAGSGADPVHDLDEDGFIDWLEEVLGSNPADSSSIPSVDFTPGDMLWAQTNNSLVTLNSEIIELCVGDCIKLHATGVADSWEVLQGRGLVLEVQPDTPNSCFSGRWCFTGTGDVIFASSTPQADGSVVLGYLQVRVLLSGCPAPCITVSGAPEYACPGDVICLQASGANGEPGDYQWSVLEFASFVGSSTGPLVCLLIEETGEIAVGVTKGQCAGVTAFIAMGVDLDIDSNNNGIIGPEDDEIEEDTPGKFVALNDDDDNGNGVSDRDEGAPIPDEDDLVPLALTADTFGVNDYLWRLTFPSNMVHVWEQQDRSGSLSSAVWQDPPIPATLYIEGRAVSTNSGDVKIDLELSIGGDVLCPDTVSVTVVGLWVVGRDFSLAINDNTGIAIGGGDADIVIPLNESLNVSNYRTNANWGESDFNSAGPDPDTFRIQAQNAGRDGGVEYFTIESVRIEADGTE
ncbi:MAG: FG-GAP repeat protein [Chloroflexi bacterium]|nr:FG-GAP repeat protein [Chloroflexota bacterium]